MSTKNNFFNDGSFISNYPDKKLNQSKHYKKDSSRIYSLKSLIGFDKESLFPKIKESGFNLLNPVLICIIIILFIKNGRLKIEQSKLLERKAHCSEEESSPKVGYDSNKDAEILIKIKKILIEEKKFLEKGLTLDKFSKLLKTNRSYLSKCINKNYNLSFSQLINYLRIEESIILLRDINYIDYSIAGIAETVGYSNTVSFNIAFKNLTNMTPSKFRNVSSDNLRFNEQLSVFKLLSIRDDQN